MIRFCQPRDYVHKGRNVWFNPADVMKITGGENYSQCIVTLRNGDAVTVDMTQQSAAEAINKALDEERNRKDNE